MTTLDDHAHYVGYDTEPAVHVLLLGHALGIDGNHDLRRRLQRDPVLLGQLGFDTVPSSTTIWRIRTKRFDGELYDAVREAAHQIATECRENGLDAPGPTQPTREPTDDRDGRLGSQSPVLAEADRVTDAARREVYPALSLDRAENTAIDESAFWSLAAYLGLQSDAHANAGARRYLSESSQMTPLGDNFRDQLSSISIEEQREQLRDAARNIVLEAQSEGYLDREVPVAIDTTTGPRFWGDRTGREETILGTKTPSGEYAHHYATVQIVTDDAPVVLDARPVRLGESRDEIVADLLNSATEIVAPTVVLMDREFDTRGVRGVCETQGLRYLTPGSRVGEQSRIERLDRGNVDMFRDSEPSLAGPDREVLYQRAESDEIQTTISNSSEADEDRTEQSDLWLQLDDTLDVDLGVEENQKERAMWDALDDMMDDDGEEGDEETATYYLWKTNLSLPNEDEAAINRVTRLYSKRWRIESGYRALKKFLTPTTSPSHELRFWYFSFASLLYSVWRLVDVILRKQEGVESDGPVVPAATVVSFLRRSTGVG
ncbi:transposase [Halobaculum sp. MBLA0147]|uniref:transposase n=1 Tax=Halobaculum sp. MBLA0147 TaxID=3079934 RepID=UPI003524BF38